MDAFQFVKNLPIQRKLILITLLTSTFGLLLAGSAFIINERSHSHNNLVQDILVLGKLIADRSTAALLFDDPKTASENLSALKVKDSIIAARIYNSDGSIFASYKIPGMENISFPEPRNDSWHGFQSNNFILFEPIFLDGKKIGTICIQAGLYELERFATQYFISAVFILFFSGILAFLLSAQLHKFVSEPLSNLTQTAKIVTSDKNYSVRAVQSSDDEIGILVKAFNGMLETIDTQNKELIESNKTLELRVQQRTSELSRAKDMAEAANTAKSAFLANMSHEIRTPLNAVLGFAQIILHDQSLSPENRHNIETINRSGEHLLTLINNILEMAKIESGHVSINKEPSDLSELLQDIVEMFRPATETKKIWLRFEPSLTVPRFIETDSAKLRQILLNLIGNSIKFTRQGGITLRVDCLQNNDQANLIFEVEDTGKGISTEDINRIFDAFEQTAEGRQSQGGTGLGLAISKQYSRLLGGNISVKSEYNKGSIFQFVLPATISTNQPHQIYKKVSRRVIGIKGDRPSQRLLIVDDRSTNREVLLKMLSPFGFTFFEAENGKEALEACSSRLPDIIFMDVVMPVMDGCEATQRIRELPGGKDIPIIAVSASAFEEQMKKVLQLGANDFLRKPIRENELYEKVTLYLNVEFLYEEEKDNNDSQENSSELPFKDKFSEQLLLVPDNLVKDIFSASEKLDKEELLKLVNPLEITLPVFTQHIQKLVETYRFDMIQELLMQKVS
ncbi:MAG: response regulator [Candidatus Riflebacteria bacterium]|nr:response regulator [Candidatus Riflebacteria bacterium]